VKCSTWIYLQRPLPVSFSELGSIFYTEFRYVYRSVLSSRVSKILRTLFVQNSTLRANEAGRNLFLKCRCLYFSPVIGFRYISLQCPAILCQHNWSPLDLVALFHSQNILVKSFTVFVTDFPENFWEKLQVEHQKVDFQNHNASHSFVRSQQVLLNIVIFHCFLIS